MTGRAPVAPRRGARRPLRRAGRPARAVLGRDAGQILGIIGPNGAGKSSCFAAVTNSVRHDGDVHLDGARVTDLPTDPRRPRPPAHLPAERVLRRSVGARQYRRRAASPSTRPGSHQILAPWRRRPRGGGGRGGGDSCWSVRAAPSTTASGPPNPVRTQRMLSVAWRTDGARALLLDEPAAGTGGTDMRRLAQVLIEPPARHRRRRDRAPHGPHHERWPTTSWSSTRGVISPRGRPPPSRPNPAVREAYLGRSA